MKIHDIDIGWLDKELDEIKYKPICYDTVKWYAVLMSLKHRLEKEEDAIEEAIEHVSEPQVHSNYRTLSRYEAREWASHLRNEDGTKGEHWTMDQTKAVQRAHDMKCDEAEFYAVINALYSDYSEVMESIGVTDKDVEFWAKFAKAWLHDEDAKQHKAMRYYKCIVNK